MCIRDSQKTAVIPNKLAIAGRPTAKSAAISIRNGARVEPLAVAANMPIQQAITSAQGIVGTATPV